MIRVRLFLYVDGNDRWGGIHRDVELPVVFPGLLVGGYTADRMVDSEAIHEVEYDLEERVLVARLPDWEEDRPFDEMMGDEFRDWTVDFVKIRMDLVESPTHADDPAP